MKKISMLVVLAMTLSLLVSVAYAGFEGSVPQENQKPAKPTDTKELVKAMKEAKNYIVTLKADATETNIAALSDKHWKLKKLNDDWSKAYSRGFLVELTPDQAEALMKDELVERVDLDAEVNIALETANYWGGVTKTRADPPIGYGVSGDNGDHPYNYSSKDVVIAIVDTGIDANHTDLNGTDNGGTTKVIGWYDAINRRTYPYDDHGHGTHVASIAAGEGDDNPRYKGVAPGAALVGVKVLNQYGSGSFSGIISGVNWVINNSETLGIKVMSLSLGGYGSSDGTDPLSIAINNAVDSGITVTVAAGNSGSQKYTISSPGASAKAITVGAMADPGYLLKLLPGVSANELSPPANPDKDPSVKGQLYLGDNGWYLAPWSSRGPTAYNALKPDIVAPGVNIMAAKSNSYARGPHGGYISMSGTSMSTPYVAGVVALMYDANYDLTPAMIKDILTATAEDYGIPGCDYDYGCGRVRAYKAVGYVETGSTPTGDVAGPTHLRYSSYLTDRYNRIDYPVSVTNDNYPVASTLILYDWSGYSAGYDFDLYLKDNKGNYVGSSGGVSRQETISISPDSTGRWNATVDKWVGSGRYALDISKK